MMQNAAQPGPHHAVVVQAGSPRPNFNYHFNSVMNGLVYPMTPAEVFLHNPRTNPQPLQAGQNLVRENFLVTPNLDALRKSDFCDSARVIDVYYDMEKWINGTKRDANNALIPPPPLTSPTNFNQNFAPNLLELRQNNLVPPNWRARINPALGRNALSWDQYLVDTMQDFEAMDRLRDLILMGRRQNLQFWQDFYIFPGYCSHISYGTEHPGDITLMNYLERNALPLTLQPIYQAVSTDLAMVMIMKALLQLDPGSIPPATVPANPRFKYRGAVFQIGWQPYPQVRPDLWHAGLAIISRMVPPAGGNPVPTYCFIEPAYKDHGKWLPLPENVISSASQIGFTKVYHFFGRQPPTDNNCSAFVSGIMRRLLLGNFPSFQRPYQEIDLPHCRPTTARIYPTLERIQMKVPDWLVHA